MPSRSASRKTLSEQDTATWAAYAQTVAPLAGRRVPVVPGAGEAPSRAEAAVAIPAVARAPARAPLNTGVAPLITGAAPAGLDRGSWNRFRTGRLASMRTLDLHGKTVQAAYHALHRFLLAAHADHVRCVEVITGRGSGENGGAIRRELPIWLNQTPLRTLILAASHPHALNPGSTRLLLRKARGEAR